MSLTILGGASSGGGGGSSELRDYKIAGDNVSFSQNISNKTLLNVTGKGEINYLALEYLGLIVAYSTNDNLNLQFLVDNETYINLSFVLGSNSTSYTPYFYFKVGLFTTDPIYDFIRNSHLQTSTQDGYPAMNFLNRHQSIISGFYSYKPAYMGGSSSNYAEFLPMTSNTASFNITGIAGQANYYLMTGRFFTKPIPFESSFQIKISNSCPTSSGSNIQAQPLAIYTLDE